MYLGFFDLPIFFQDLQNESVVVSLVTMAKKKVDLVCEKCGEKRASILGYISHVLYMCQKTEEVKLTVLFEVIFYFMKIVASEKKPQFFSQFCFAPPSVPGLLFLKICHVAVLGNR